MTLSYGMTLWFTIIVFAPLIHFYHRSYCDWGFVIIFTFLWRYHAKAKQQWQTRAMNTHHPFLTYWGWVMHKYVSKLTITGSDNGLLPGRRWAIIWTNAGILLLELLGTNFSDILFWNSYIFMQGNAFENVSCKKMLYISSHPQCVYKN